MSEEMAIIQDLQQSLDRNREDRDKWRAIAYSLAKYHAQESDKTVFEIIEDERKWIEQQADWNENNGR